MQHFEKLGVNLISESIYVRGECGIKKHTATAVGVAIWIVGSVFLFLVFCVCHGCCGKSLCIRLICLL